MAKKGESGLDIIRRTGHGRKTTRAFRRATGKRRSGCLPWLIATATITAEIVRRVR